jgi:hypothetical protein
MFVWSVVLEPLLFFVLFGRTQSAVTGNVSRLLQAIVLAVLGVRGLVLLLRTSFADIRLIDPRSPLYRNYLAYFALAVLAGIVGAFSGAYSLPVAYDAEGRSVFATMLNSSAMRPMFEYVVAGYYFAYFVVLPQYILQTEKALDYFFTVFSRLFVLSFVIGFVDLALSAVGIYALPRHLSEAGQAFTGIRYHGLAGEPRHAFSFLLLGLAVFHLAAWLRGRRLSRWWIAGVTIAALFTQSGSGLLGVLFFVGLYCVYNARHIRPRGFLWGLSLVLLLGFGVYITVATSERIQAYLKVGQGLWFVLESGRQLPYLAVTQISSIYPLYDLTVKLRQFDWLPIAFGSGFGSASALNNMIPNAMPVAIESQLTNPNSQLVRTLYESGLIGTWFFLLSFTTPTRYLTRRLGTADRRAFLVFTLLLLGGFLANRNSASFIYLGVCIAAFRLLDSRYIRMEEASEHSAADRAVPPSRPASTSV